MTNGHRADSAPLAVSVGFAAHTDGKGVAYAALDGCGGPSTIVRVPFALTLRPALRGRDVAYAALNALAEELLHRGMTRVELRVDDASVVADVAERRSVPAALTVPYVSLRCRLNRFERAELTVRQSRMSRDLTSRARAEASLQIAA